MIRANIIFVCCFVFSMSASYAESEVRDNKTDIITQILSLSGLDYQIEQLPIAIENSMSQQPLPPIGRDRLKIFQEIFLTAFEPSLVRDTLTQYFEKHYDEGRFSDLLALLKLPLVSKMTELEKQVSTHEAQQEMMMTGNVLMGQALPERFELISRLDKAMQTSESMLDTQVMISRIMAEGIDPLLPEDKRLQPGQLDLLINQVRAQLIYPVRQFAALSLMFTFRSVSDDDLRAYIDLHESEIAQWSTRLVNDAYREVFERAIQRVTETLQRELVKDHAA